MVFKPIPKFSEPDCDDEGFIIAVEPWSLSGDYTDVDGDEADLTDIFGPYGQQQYWVCFYHWDTTNQALAARAPTCQLPPEDNR